MNKKYFQGLSLSEQLIINMTMRQQRERLIERVVELLDLTVMGIPIDPFLSADISLLEEDLILAENGDSRAKIRILLLLKDRTLGAAVSAKGDSFMSNSFRSELIRNGEEFVEREPDTEAVEKLMTSYFEILEKLEECGITVSAHVCEYDYLLALRELVDVGTSRSDLMLEVMQKAEQIAAQRNKEELEKIKKVQNQKRDDD